MKPYPKYRESGIEWLGKIPEGWEVKPLGIIFTFSKGLTITKDDLRDEGTPCVNYGEIHSKYGVMLNPAIHPLRCVETEAVRKQPDTLLQEGEFVFADTSEDLEGSGNFTCLVSKTQVAAGYHTVIARPKVEMDSPFFAHEFHSSAFRSQIQRQVKGIKVFSITQGILKNTCCWMPPLAEQQAIASFLDRETAKIDEAIKATEESIELLQEERKTIISHAVTKGLDPKAKMKDSGVEWLGGVPEHWEVKRIKFFAEILRGKFTHRPRNDPAFYDGDYPFVQTGDITGTSRYITEYKQTLNEKGAAVSKEFPKRTLVMAIAANIGDVAILNFPAYFPDSIVGLVPSSKVSLMYLFYLMGSMKEPMIRTATISTQMNLNVEQISSLTAGCPPLTEQEAIATYLDEKTSQIDSLIAEKLGLIESLQEYRTSLIHEAVTGKIDLREEAA